MFSFSLGKAGMVLVAGEVSMMRERGGYIVEMSASSSNSVRVAKVAYHPRWANPSLDAHHTPFHHWVHIIHHG